MKKKKEQEMNIKKEEELIIIQMKKENTEKIKNPQGEENLIGKVVPGEVKK